MRLSPPISVIAIVALGFAALVATKPATADWLEVSATTPWVIPAKANGKPVMRFGVIQIHRNGNIRLEIRQWNSLETGSNDSFQMREWAVQSAQTASEAFSIAKQLQKDAIDLNDREAIEDLANGFNTKDRHGRQLHLCGHRATDIHSQSIEYHYLGGQAARVSIAPPGCIDQYSIQLGSQIERIRSIALTALRVDAERTLRQLK